jgi:hypothetical protein
MRWPSRSTQVPRARSCLAGCIAVTLTACFFGGGTGDAWNAPPFSADLYDLRSPGKPPTRIYIGAGKLRIQSTDPGQTTAFVFDPQHGTTMVIDDKAKTYIDAGMFSRVVAAGAAPFLHLFRPAEGGDPCSVWNGTVDQFAAFGRGRSGPPPHFTCQSAGSDKVDGRPAQKWTVTTQGGDQNQGGPATVWIDDHLHVISRSIDANGQSEMRNIKEGEPAADLFVPPGGYRKIGVTDFLGALSHTTPGGGPSAPSGDKPSDSAASAKTP